MEVFQYTDYRSFLRDYYQQQKDAGRGFSYRVFARRVGLGSPGYLKRVIEGERSLTPEMTRRFAEGCRLSGEAATYFCHLVAFTQARSSVERQEHYQKMVGMRGFQLNHTLAREETRYHSRWYIPAVRELVSHTDFVEDPAWIAGALNPTISKAEARKALNTLLELGLLQRNSKGQLVQTTAVVTTEDEVRAVHVATYHREMMHRASASIDLFPSESRDISAVTLGLSARGLARVKAKIQRFRRELLELGAAETTVEQVIQVNFQLFPLSQTTKRAEKKNG